VYLLRLPDTDLGLRIKVIRRILSPLLEGRPPLVIGNPANTPWKKTFAAWDSGFSSDSEGARMFKTSVHHLYGAYEERWQLDIARREWALERIYLTLLAAQSHVDPPSEILCIHCDPLDDSYSLPPRLPRVKQGPHLHIECADQPIPRCHFPLDYCNLDDILSSVSSLTDAFESLIQALASEMSVHF
jgi:hypothetical protein